MSKKKNQSPLQPSFINLSGQQTVGLAIFFISISIVSSAGFIIYSHFLNGKSGVPLDDAFIHLTFAKNLSEFYSFSYHKDLMVTAGSSSPLYTIILALGFKFIGNEFVLLYLLGTTFFVFFTYVFFKLLNLSANEFKSHFYFTLFASLLVVSDKWLIFFSVSGMETILFVLSLTTSAYFYKTKRAVLLAISIGLMIWIRPEGIIFLLALLADYFILIIFLKKGTKSKTKFTRKEIIQIMSIFLFFVSSYIMMNLYLSGTILPNAFYAKRIFYSPDYMSRTYFLKSEVWDYFTEGSYGILMFGFIISILKLLLDLFKREINNELKYVIFIFLFVFVYWYEMPYSGMLGRYMVALIPFFIIVSVSGFFTFYFILKNFFKNSFCVNYTVYFFVLFVFYFVSSDLITKLNLYTEECKYIRDTHIAAAQWLKENSSPGDIIATHDIGAIGFYSGREIVDIAGIVTPFIINKLPDKNYNVFMESYLKERKVKYFITMKKWYRIVNVNPVFSSRGNANFDVLNIYKYEPEKFHILSKEVNKLLHFAEYNLSKNFPSLSLKFLNQAIVLDSMSSLSFYLKADSYSKLHDIKNYERSLLRAVEIFPDYPKANLKLANFYKEKNDFLKWEKFIDRYNDIIYHSNTNNEGAMGLSNNKFR
ncbi:MAG: hypothetical protein M3R36_09590 [Bacteroidota bacterium]|nr:hypothetical protein [Bacteroidota bacterium]